MFLNLILQERTLFVPGIQVTIEYYVKDGVNIATKLTSDGDEKNLRKLGKNKNKDSRSDDACLVPLLYFRHQLNVK